MLFRSLEVRSPLLDHRIIEFALRLPASRLLRLSPRHGPQTKAILKDAMGDILPGGILHRRKRGFSSPVSSWLGTAGSDASTAPLRSLMQDALARPMDAFDPAVVRAIASGTSGSDGRPVDPLQAWDLLVLHLWHDWAQSWRGPDAPGPVTVGSGATPSHSR